jgi:hypothetical protein
MKKVTWMKSFVFKSVGECLTLNVVALSVPVNIRKFLFHVSSSMIPQTHKEHK